MSIALGLGLQIAMSFVIALIYNLAFSRVPGLRHSPFIFGALYGVVTFVVMWSSHSPERIRTTIGI